jgi:hypothetical protein
VKLQSLWQVLFKCAKITRIFYAWNAMHTSVVSILWPLILGYYNQTRAWSRLAWTRRRDRVRLKDDITTRLGLHDSRQCHKQGAVIWSSPPSPSKVIRINPSSSRSCSSRPVQAHCRRTTFILTAGRGLREGMACTHRRLEDAAQNLRRRCDPWGRRAPALG